MLRPWSLFIPCVVLLVFGCARPSAPALQPGDVVWPEISVAPNPPWTTGDQIAIGMLVRVERPGGGSNYLKDEDVAVERVVMGARVSFLDGERLLGDPHEVSLVHDC